MSFPTIPHALSSLSPREAIADAVHRALHGLDTNDIALFDSALTHDAIFEVNDTRMEGLDKIHSGCFDKVGRLDTTHTVSTMRIDVKDGASTAVATATGLSQHCPPGQGTEPGAKYFLDGALYYMEFVKDSKDGPWKVTLWRLRAIWTQGDVSVVSGTPA